jgi:hypothetical protein
MSLSQRINIFWLGAGALLTTFGSNEVIAHHQSKVSLWLGGSYAYVGGVIAALSGLAIMYGLGIETQSGEERVPTPTFGEPVVEQKAPVKRTKRKASKKKLAPETTLLPLDSPTSFAHTGAQVCGLNHHDNFGEGI